RLIALVADRYDYRTQQDKEILRMHRINKLRRKVRALIEEAVAEKYQLSNDQREAYSKGINEETPRYTGYYHGVSLGGDDGSLMDFYVSKNDTRLVYLKKEDKMRRKREKKNKNKENQ
ncbi:MAG: LapA family protein, partial [Prevotellaceae bacterium]|nr:LapA family protein [Prevotellaceae bacterium]